LEICFPEFPFDSGPVIGRGGRGINYYPTASLRNARIRRERTPPGIRERKGRGKKKVKTTIAKAFSRIGPAEREALSVQKREKEKKTRKGCRVGAARP